jgi:hypothetical protein
VEPGLENDIEITGVDTGVAVDPVLENDIEITGVDA